MSFSSSVKNEIAEQYSQARHCAVAEMAAIVGFCGKFVIDANGKHKLVIVSENDNIYRKCFTLLKKTFNILSLVVSEDNFTTHRELIIEDANEAKSLLQALKFIKDDGTIRRFSDPVSSLIIKNGCCKRAYLRGAFLCAGSISDPNKGYHLEMVCDVKEQADKIIELLADFDLEAKCVVRKLKFVVYMKEGAAIVDFLNICEAHISLMELENLRIVREMRNSINRRVNCEAANITKTVNAATKQIEEIEYLRDYYGLDNLPPNLHEMALVRLEHPDASLAELGEYLDPPVGKSGVNHRLRRLSEIAGQM